MDRLRRARAVHRGRVTKTINELTAELAKDPADHAVLRNRIERLQEALQEVTEGDQQILDAMLDAEAPEEELNQEVAAMDEYKDQGRAMATTAKIAKEQKKPKFKVRLRNRCHLCGRPRAFMRKFGLCRLCFRKLALEGDVTGVTKSSW